MLELRVDILLPEGGALPVAHWAQAARLWHALGRGWVLVTAVSFDDAAQRLVAKGVWSRRGSANRDPRSLRLDVTCLAAALAGRLAGAITADGRRCRLVLFGDGVCLPQEDVL